MNEELVKLADAIIADGVITEKERTVLRKKAQELGVDPDETEVLVEGRIDSLRNNSEDSIRNKWCFIEPEVFPPLSDLDDVLLQIRRGTNDKKLQMIRMKKAIYSFPLPKQEKDIFAILELLSNRCEKKSAGIFAKKSEKEDARVHNTLIPLWKDKCEEIIMESRLLFMNNEQVLAVLDSYSDKLDL